MRWERLFEDLQAQLEAESDSELAGEVSDRTRRERALLGLHERFAAIRSVGPVTVEVRGLGVLVGQVADVGADWVLITAQAAHSVLLPFASVRGVLGLAGRITPAGTVAKGFTLGAALRAVSRDRAVVTIVDAEGGRRCGTIDAVGRDTLDLAEHPADLPRRPEHVTDTRTIPFAAVAAIIRV